MGKTNRNSKAYRVYAFYLAGALAAGVSCGLVFVSIEIALLVAGFSALCGYIAFEQNRRAHWEKSIQFKMDRIVDNHDKLVREVSRNHNDIFALKEGIKKTARRLSSEQNKLRHDVRQDVSTIKQTAQALDALAARPRSGAETIKNKVMDLEVGPVGVVPQKSSWSAQSAAANDETASNVASGNSSVNGQVIKELLRQTIQKGEVDVFLQPVVRLPQRQIRYYEIFARIRAKAGLYLKAEDYMAIANQMGLTNDIDDLLLKQSLQVIQKSAHLDRAIPFILNVRTQTLKHVRFMTQLLTFLSKNKALAGRLVLEIQQSDFENMHPAILEVMRGLGKLGCHFSLDGVESLNFDITLLQDMRFKMIKIDALTFMKNNRSQREFTKLWKMKRQLESQNIAVVAQKIETEYVLKEILDFNLHYGQGYLFGKPDLMAAYQERSAA